MQCWSDVRRRCVTRRSTITVPWLHRVPVCSTAWQYLHCKLTTSSATYLTHWTWRTVIPHLRAVLLRLCNDVLILHAQRRWYILCWCDNTSFWLSKIIFKFKISNSSCTTLTPKVTSGKKLSQRERVFKQKLFQFTLENVRLCYFVNCTGQAVSSLMPGVGNTAFDKDQSSCQWFILTEPVSYTTHTLSWRLSVSHCFFCVWQFHCQQFQLYVGSQCRSLPHAAIMMILILIDSNRSNTVSQTERSEVKGHGHRVNISLDPCVCTT